MHSRLSDFGLLLPTIMAVGLSAGHPINYLIESWNQGNLEATVQVIKDRMINAIWLTSALMIGTFVCALVALFIRRK